MDKSRQWLTVIFLSAVVLAGFGLTDDLRVRSTELKIVDGSEIKLDGKTIGAAPCEITMQMNLRHTLEAKSPAGIIRFFFLATKEGDNQAQTKNMPAWFLNPDVVRSEFPDYDTLAAATAISRMLQVAISKADVEATAKLAQGRANALSSSLKPDLRTMLDSARSRTLPERTRGQMDSISRATGGTTIVRSFSGTVTRTVLQYEIQKIGDTFRVYVLVGHRKG
jgi:hypothetical protein